MVVRVCVQFWPTRASRNRRFWTVGTSYQVTREFLCRRSLALNVWSLLEIFGLTHSPWPRRGPATSSSSLRPAHGDRVKNHDPAKTEASDRLSVTPCSLRSRPCRFAIGAGAPSLDRSCERRLGHIWPGQENDASTEQKNRRGRLRKWQARFSSPKPRPEPPMSAVSPVRSPLATRPAEDLRHDRATPARYRALPPSRWSPGWTAVCSRHSSNWSSRFASVCTASVHCCDRLRRSAGRRYRITTGGFADTFAAVALRRAL